MGRIAEIFKRMGVNEASPEKGVVVKNRALNSQPLDLAMVKVGSKEVWVTPNTKLTGFDSLKELKINQKVKVTYKDTDRGLEAETLSEELYEADEDDLELVADVMHNSIEHMDDLPKEAIDHIVKETSLAKADVEKFVKAEFQNFLKGKYIKNKTTDDMALLKRYF